MINIYEIYSNDTCIDRERALTARDAVTQYILRTYPNNKSEMRIKMQIQSINPADQEGYIMSGYILCNVKNIKTGRMHYYALGSQLFK